MSRKSDFLNDFIKKIMNQEKESLQHFSDTQDEIRKHTESMRKNREKFKLIRNK
ncbi:hypothetical protein [Bacillus inaquosorum]|uniref:hypothetical protein n=1 Tax=Bacillus inaquosorum TaxID=483913 RepID=UPI0015863F8E|nr:hypothetical protein [Bacillus inaquosorum]MCY8239118.1 hypothetical protein [Bacillus inaquosorum]MEC2065071.1 hypothetical protein [Bacillus inaquosorum]MEC2084692.1 hypothetical protein [Bacillus inaquosorum]